MPSLTPITPTSLTLTSAPSLASYAGFYPSATTYPSATLYPGASYFALTPISATSLSLGAP